MDGLTPNHKNQSLIKDFPFGSVGFENYGVEALFRNCHGYENSWARILAIFKMSSSGKQA